ncbi:polyhydroxyalkanoic acid system family protein [Haliangium sp.]|uniref:polyhydroxyalkanoic acid system family protein n=1 Tax=Haliangium sp. TaxID=2663208 RepID=UPI003D0995AE
MDIEYAYDLPLDDARARLEALGEYLTNRHGLRVQWSGDQATVNGKYLVVKIEGEMKLTPGRVRFSGRDPGMLWRKKAKDYLHGKLATYLDPRTPVDELPRNK